MKHQLLNKISRLSLFVLTTLFLNSCFSYYECFVSGFGSTPADKSYYLEPIDSSLVDNLEYLEYADILRNRLRESGYLESAPQDAALCIRFGYFIGDKRVNGIKSASSSFSMSNGKITANTNAKTNGSAKTNVKGNSVSTNVKASGTSSTVIDTQQITNTFTSSGADISYGRDIGCYIEAINTENMKPVWTVEAKDYIKYSNESLRKNMPWMLASAQYYFGKSGKEIVVISKKEGIKKGLTKF